ncbi:MAG: hypothetical protein R2822_23035 [Spirosomataceae bacterium]
MKTLIISIFLGVGLGFMRPKTNETYSIEAVSICAQANPSLCLSVSQKNRLREDTPYTVEVVLKSNNANLLNDQVQAIQLEVGEVSLACARSSSNIDNCPSGSSQEWKTLYQHPTPASGTTLVALENTKLIKPLSNKDFAWRSGVKSYPAEILDKPSKMGASKLNLSASMTLKSPYYIKVKADNIRFPDWVWGVRIGVYQRNGGVQQSEEFKTRF